jgi:hypothetical protein
MDGHAILIRLTASIMVVVTAGLVWGTFLMIVISPR